MTGISASSARARAAAGSADRAARPGSRRPGAESGCRPPQAACWGRTFAPGDDHLHAQFLALNHDRVGQRLDRRVGEHRGHVADREGLLARVAAAAVSVVIAASAGADDQASAALRTSAVPRRILISPPGSSRVRPVSVFVRDPRPDVTTCRPYMTSRHCQDAIAGTTVPCTSPMLKQLPRPDRATPRSTTESPSSRKTRRSPPTSSGRSPAHASSIRLPKESGSRPDGCQRHAGRPCAAPHH